MQCCEHDETSLITPEFPSEILSRKTLYVANYTYCYVSTKHFGNEKFVLENMPYRKFLSKNSIVGKVINEVFFYMKLHC